MEEENIKKNELNNITFMIIQYRKWKLNLKLIM